MISTKALCVVFLLYSSIDKSQSLKNISSSVKRTTDLEKVNQNANIIGTTIKAKLIQPNKKYIGHSAYIYLQPESSQEVTYENENVKSIFQQTVAYQLPATVWPDQKEVSNFRMAIPEKKKDHAEFQLLANDGLEAMIDEFTAAHPKPGTVGTCPQYVIFYSYLLPCPDCANKIAEASKKFKSHALCKGTPFYLYVEKPEYTKDNKYFERSRNILTDAQAGIIWSNYPGPRTGTPMTKS